MLKKVMIISNPTAGQGKAKDYSLKLKEVLEAHYKCRCQIWETKKEGDAIEFASQAGQGGFDTAICLGGDGTVRETVQGLLTQPSPPNFAFIPLGTVNDLARATGIPRDPDQAVLAFRHLQASPLDIGQVNGQVFINVVALGPIPEAVMQTSPDEKETLGSLAYVKDGITSFFSTEGYSLKITDDQGQIHQLKSNLVLVGLTRSVAGIDSMFPEASHHDGLLHLAAIKGHTPLAILQGFLEKGLEAASLAEDLDGFLSLKGSSFYIEPQSKDPISSNVDGDPGPSLPLKLEVLNQAVTLLIPQV